MATYKGTTINPGTDAQVAAQVAAVDGSTVRPQPPLVPTNPTSPAVPMTPVAATAVSPAKAAMPLSTLTTPAPTVAQPAPGGTPTLADGFHGYMSAITGTNGTAFQQDLDKQAVAAKQGYTGSLDAYLKETLGAATPTQLISQAYAQDGGVDQSKRELLDINNQIIAEQTATRRRIEKVQKENPKGIGAEVVQQQVDQINKDSIEKQADLAIIQLSKQGKYDSAKEIADRAVQAATEREKQRMDALQLSFQVNKDLFDKADQKAFTSAQDERKRQLDNEEYRLRAKFDQTLKQSDPLYQLQVQQAKASIANTYSEIGARRAAAAANDPGSSSGPLAAQTAYSKLNTTQKGKADALNNLVRYLGEYRTLYQQKTSKDGSRITGPDAGLLESKLNSLLFAAAQAEGTGALQAADRAVLEKVLPNPTTFKGAVSTYFKGGQTGGLSKIDDQITKYTNNLTETYGVTPTRPAASVIPTAAVDPLGVFNTSTNPLRL